MPVAVDRLRVLLIAPYFDAGQPGESWSTYQWVRGISARCETTVLTCHPAGWSDDGSTGAAQVVNWVDRGLPGLGGRIAWELKPGYPQFAWRARRWIKQALRRGERFDLVHQINPLALRYPCPARGLGQTVVIGPLAGSLATPAPLAAAARETSWFRKLRALDQLRLRHDPWLRGSYAEAAVVLGVAPYVAGLLAGCHPRRFEVMAETGVERVAEHAKRAPRAGEPLRLLFVGRLIRTKGIIEAIRAVQRVGKRANVHLDVLGAGELLDACREEVARLGIERRVTFHGRVDRAEVFRWYQRAHVFLFPSFREPSGNVVFEALSHGLPVIACNYGGPGFVVDATCGRTVDPAITDVFAERLADVIVALANAPEDFARLSAGALERMRRHALWPAKIDRLMQVYAEVACNEQPVRLR